MAEDNGWMLEQVLAMPGVRHALVGTTDGLAVQHSDSLERDRADPLAALGASYASLGVSLADTFGTDARKPRRTWIDFEGGMCFVERAGRNGFLLVIAHSHGVDPELITQAMQQLRKQLGDHNFDTAARSAP